MNGKKFGFILNRALAAAICILIAVAVAIVFVSRNGAEALPTDRNSDERGNWNWNSRNPGNGFELVQDVTYATVGSTQLKLDILKPKSTTESAPVIVFIHGGGWKGGDKSAARRFLPLFADHGFLCYSINYRLTDVAPFPAQIYDCKAAIRYARKNCGEYGGDPGRIGVFGTSAGGHLAALIGTSGNTEKLDGDIGVTGVSSGVQAVSDWFGPADLEKISGRFAKDPAIIGLLGGSIDDRLELAKAASPITYIDGDDPPFLIVHGDRDGTVPVEQSRMFDDALREAGVDVTYIEVKGGGHGNFNDTDPDFKELQQKLIEFFEEKLG